MVVFSYIYYHKKGEADDKDTDKIWGYGTLN